MYEKLIEIETPRGRGILEKFWISDLNFIMAKIYFPDKKVWVNYILGVNTPDNFIQKTFDEKTKPKEDT